MYPPEYSFASRLNHLIDTLHPRGREPFTNRNWPMRSCGPRLLDRARLTGAALCRSNIRLRG
jgi:hypothetical protein